MLPFKLPDNINKAYKYLGLILESGDNMYVTSYQEKVHDGIFEHVLITVRIWDNDRRCEILKQVENQNFELYRTSSGHAYKYLLHDKEEFGRYSNYEDKMICLIEFTF